MERTLDMIAPLEEKRSQGDKNKPWYTSELLEKGKGINLI